MTIERNIRTDEDGWGIAPGGLIYTLQYGGVHRGTPVYMPRLMVRIGSHGCVPDAELEDLVRDIHDFLVRSDAEKSSAPDAPKAARGMK